VHGLELRDVAQAGSDRRGRSASGPAGRALIRSPLAVRRLSFAIDDPLDQGLRVGESERAIRVGDVPLGRPASPRGKLADVIGRRGSSAVGDPIQLAALPLRRVDPRDQAFQQPGIARPEQEQAPRLSRVELSVWIESQHQHHRVTDQLVAQLGQLHTQARLDVGAGPLQVPVMFGLEPGPHCGQPTEVRRQLGAGQCPDLIAEPFHGRHHGRIRRHQPQ
jgi:hypothetical protein